MKTKKSGFTTIDEYIAACPEETRERLQAIRAAVRKVAPEAREKISYQIAAFELNGKHLIYFAGWKKHVSLYPIPAGAKREAFEKEISKYADGKGTLQFPLDRPLPIRFIQKVIRLHVANNLTNAKMNSGKGNY